MIWDVFENLRFIPLLRVIEMLGKALSGQETNVCLKDEIIPVTGAVANVK